MTIIERIIQKVTSGQWILTVCAAFVFAWATVEKILPSEAVASIITAVFTSYFRRDRSVEPAKQ